MAFVHFKGEKRWPKGYGFKNQVWGRHVVQQGKFLLATPTTRTRVPGEVLVPLLLMQRPC